MAGAEAAAASPAAVLLLHLLLSCCFTCCCPAASPAAVLRLHLLLHLLLYCCCAASHASTCTVATWYLGSPCSLDLVIPRGNFGVVRRATIRRRNLIPARFVAVKELMCSEHHECTGGRAGCTLNAEELVGEAKKMLEVPPHNNIVNFLGECCCRLIAHISIRALWQCHVSEQSALLTTH